MCKLRTVDDFARFLKGEYTEIRLFIQRYTSAYTYKTMTYVVTKGDLIYDTFKDCEVHSCYYNSKTKYLEIIVKIKEG